MLARVMWAARVFEGFPILIEPLAVTMRFYLKSEKSRGDFDNLAKLVCDAGNMVLWQDDRQIVEAHVYVVRGDPGPRTEIEVREITEEG